jgi:transposase
MILTFKYRIKDATTAKHLNRHAWASNQVWNYCCQIQREAENRWKAGLTGQKVRWPSFFDLDRLTASVAAELGLHSDTVKAICRQFTFSRDAKRKCPRFRASSGSKRALGWIPFISRAVKVEDDKVRYLKRHFRFWKSRELGGKIKTGCFTQDARGRWYVAFQCEVEDVRETGTGKVGIDLGLKTVATLSNGETIPALKHYRKYQEKLAIAQRARNKKRVKAIHAKISNSRRHHLHEQTTKIARENSHICVGNVSPSKLAKTKMAKSVLDASWAILKSQLCYKASRHRAVYIEVDERWTSQTCSSCGTNPDSSPKGMGALGIRQWTCSDCGASHDRDVNAATNILIAGLERKAPVEGIPAL